MKVGEGGMAGASEGIRAKGWRDCACGGRWLLKQRQCRPVLTRICRNRRKTRGGLLHSAWLPERCAESKTHQLAAPPVAVRSAVVWSRGLLELACVGDGVSERWRASGCLCSSVAGSALVKIAVLPYLDGANGLYEVRGACERLQPRSPHSRCWRWTSGIVGEPDKGLQICSKNSCCWPSGEGRRAQRNWPRRCSAESGEAICGAGQNVKQQ